VNQNLGLCATFAKDRSWEEMIEGFGLSAAPITTETFEEVSADLSIVKLRVGVTGCWGYAVEHLTTFGSDDDVLSRLSAGDGEAVCLAYTQTINTFMYARDGGKLSDLT
jgi:hypothetical protein